MAADHLVCTVWALPAMTQRLMDDFAEHGLSDHAIKELDDSSPWGVVSTFLEAITETENTVDSRYELVEPLILTIHDRPIPVTITVTWHREYDAASIIASLTIPAGTVDDEHMTDLTIAVLHAFRGRCASSECALAIDQPQGGEPISLGQAVIARVAAVYPGAHEELSSHCSTATCVEIRDRSDGSARWDPARLQEAYGLATGDEGWRWVENDLAASRLGQSWATRDFVDVRSAGDGVVVRNFKGPRYRELQSSFTNVYFGGEVDYFGHVFDIAGLDHGVLHVLERVTIRRALARQWLNQARAAGRDTRRSHGRGPRGTSRRTQVDLLRQELDSVHTLIGSALITEVDSLENLLADRLGLDHLIEALDRRAESIDEATRFRYERSTSRKINALTGITAFLAALTLIATFVHL